MCRQFSAILGFCLVLNSFVTLGCQFSPIIYAVVRVPPEKIKFSTVNKTATTEITVKAASSRAH